jgi:hypothetical protein
MINKLYNFKKSALANRVITFQTFYKATWPISMKTFLKVRKVTMTHNFPKSLMKTCHFQK